MRLIAVLALPYPPSVNAYWRSAPRARKRGHEIRATLASTPNAGWREVAQLVGVNVYRTREGNQFREAVAARVLKARLAHELIEGPITGILDARIVAYPPPLQRTRDADNLLKALLDGIAYAGVILDDSQLVDVRIRWGTPRSGGSCVVALGRPDDATDEAFLGLDRMRESVDGKRLSAFAVSQPDLF